MPMDAVSQALQGIHRRVDKLLGVLGRMEAERNRLENRVAELEHQLAARTEENQDLHTRLALAVTSPSAQTASEPDSPERAALRARIDEMLTQIDDCLRLMNE